MDLVDEIWREIYKYKAENGKPPYAVLVHPSDFVKIQGVIGSRKSANFVTFYDPSDDSKNVQILWAGVPLKTIKALDAFDSLSLLMRASCECGAEKTGSNKHSTWCPKV